jgi:hypothetical protein
MVYVPAHFQNLSDWVMAVPGKFKSIVVVGVTAVIWSTFETPEMQLCLIMSAHVRNPNVAVYIISHCIESWSMLRKASLRQEHCNAAQRLAGHRSQAARGCEDSCRKQSVEEIKILVLVIVTW